MAEKKNKYVEPADFIPDAIQKKLKIGKYAEPEKPTEQEKAKANKAVRYYGNGK